MSSNTRLPVFVDLENQAARLSIDSSPNSSNSSAPPLTSHEQRQLEELRLAQRQQEAALALQAPPFSPLDLSRRPRRSSNPPPPASTQPPLTCASPPTRQQGSRQSPGVVVTARVQPSAYSNLNPNQAYILTDSFTQLPVWVLTPVIVVAPEQDPWYLVPASAQASHRQQLDSSLTARSGTSASSSHSRAQPQPSYQRWW